MTSGGSRGGARGARPPPLILDKKEEMTEGKMAAMASKSRPGPPLSSRSGSANGDYFGALELLAEKIKDHLCFDPSRLFALES